MAKIVSEYHRQGRKVEILLFENIIDFPIPKEIKIHTINVLSRRTKITKAAALFFGVLVRVWKIRPASVIGFARISSQVAALSLYPRVVARFDSYPFNIRWYRTFFSILFFNFFNVKRVVCPSEEIKERLKPYFINKRKLTVIGNAVDITEEIPEPTLVLPDKFIVVVGRLSPLKQVDKVIEAFDRTAISALFDLVIVGDGPEYNRLTKMAAGLSSSQKIHFTGFVPHPVAIMAKASLLVLASLKEGFPTVLVEALSAGVPVLSSNCKSGPSEIVQPGINGWLFEPEKAEALQTCFEQIAANPDYLNNVKRNCRSSVWKFRTETIMSKWDEAVLHQIP